MKRNIKKVWGARYTLGAHNLSKNTVIDLNLVIVIEAWEL
jgi:hypothetical protein